MGNERYEHEWVVADQGVGELRCDHCGFDEYADNAKDECHVALRKALDAAQREREEARAEVVRLTEPAALGNLLAVFPDAYPEYHSLSLEYDRDYGLGRSSGWTVHLNGICHPQFVRDPMEALRKALPGAAAPKAGEGSDG